MLPIILAALSLLSLSVEAQQSLPLPPKADAPKLSPTQGIPQQSVADLKNMATPPVAPSAASEAPASLNSKEGEIKRLLDLPSFNLQTSKAQLSDVIALLADACHMNYVGLEKGLADNVQISVNINKNPYEILTYLGERYNVAMSFESGIWHFGIYNDNALIARIYTMRYNSQEVSKDSGSSSSSSSSSSSGTSSGSSNVSGGADTSFSIDQDVIQKTVEKFLDLSSQDPSILTSPDFDVNSLSVVSERGIFRVLPQTAASGSATDAAAKGKVLYNSDNKSLYVMATRAQHQWIEKYITSVDKPQKQILVETKVYETGMNPETALGINWSDKNISVHDNASMNYTMNAAQSTANSTLSAILTNKQFSATLTALSKDSNTVSVQYPRQVTIANRPVAISSLEQVPVQDTTTSTSGASAGASTTQTAVRYIDVGTKISILPRILDGDKIIMDLRISVSSIAGYTTIEGNPYPNVSQREYKTQAIVESGYTLAIGGLKETTRSETVSAVPVVSKIPLFGNLFKQRGQKNTDRNLLIFISPQLLSEYRGGVKNEPEFVTPRDKDYPTYRAFDGEGEYTDIVLALSGVPHHIDELSQLAHERATYETVEADIQSTQNSLKLMRVRLQEIALQQPNKDISQPIHQIEQYISDLNELSRSISKHKLL